jgi:hypothetical protein
VHSTVCRGTIPGGSRHSGLTMGRVDCGWWGTRAQVGVMDVNACTFTGQQFIFIREAPTQKGIVLTNAANESIDPWPEVKIPPSLAPEGAVFVDVFDPLRKEFVVTNGMLYVQVRSPGSHFAR